MTVSCALIGVTSCFRDRRARLKPFVRFVNIVSFVCFVAESFVSFVCFVAESFVSFVCFVAESFVPFVCFVAESFVSFVAQRFSIDSRNCRNR
jgi:hypothetical protein